ncbi:MAG: prephenate dehydratase [Sphingomonadaceae bacterium]|uniref:prephenate dehydratase n=1 Tax=Thermaurantiacus sp. TaxID=2820283 RepID=UPI00298F2933|nr:prephenate dehydratase [Thermaurantiacus sp.]MCS6985884.1 prephenate dehydratase [Sphingomonadaceae bacterium]MDW8413847.1 prephenate dehydratase [Thermaurantiacus sp.]
MESYPAPARALVEAMRRAAAQDRRRAIAFQGAPGAYSQQAVLKVEPLALPLPLFSFEEALQAVTDGEADRAVLPVENSLHGRVADVHVLLPDSGLAIVGETYVRVEHCLVGLPGARIEGLRAVLSHPQALGQCRRRLRALGLTPVAGADTAAAAAEIVERGDPTLGAIASALAARLYGCDVLERNLEDAQHNRTRFLVLARSPADPPPDRPVKTTLAFEVKNVPAALYKALGGFATNGVNLTRLESHLDGGSFTAARFLIDIEGRPAEPAVARALEELAFHSRWVRVLGTYPTASAD